MRYIYAWFLPKQCIFCGISLQQDLAICVPCFKDLPILPHHCQVCARFMPTAIQIDSPCGACIRRKPIYQKIYALFPYEPPVIHLIIKLKFSQKLSYAQTFGELLAERVLKDWYANSPLPDLILPMPLHANRLRERGFNQAVEIAKPVAKYLNIPLDLTGILRIKATIAQTGLKAKERKSNLHQAFIANRDYHGLKIAVIDDVVTTGSTIESMCKTLKQNGAETIDIWTIARRG